MTDVSYIIRAKTATATVVIEKSIQLHFVAFGDETAQDAYNRYIAGLAASGISLKVIRNSSPRFVDDDSSGAI
jgi:hypothetical protein